MIRPSAFRLLPADRLRLQGPSIAVADTELHRSRDMARAGISHLLGSATTTGTKLVCLGALARLHVGRLDGTGLSSLPLPGRN